MRLSTSNPTNIPGVAVMTNLSLYGLSESSLYLYFLNISSLPPNVTLYSKFLVPFFSKSEGYQSVYRSPWNSMYDPVGSSTCPGRE